MCVLTQQSIPSRVPVFFGIPFDKVELNGLRTVESFGIQLNEIDVKGGHVPCPRGRKSDSIF
jgi:hypothetical protein